MRTWGLRWWELLPEGVVAVGLVLFLVLETSAATSAFESGTAIALMALVAALWLVGRLVLVRFAPWPALRLTVFALAAVAVLGVVVYPAFDDKTVTETLTVSAAQPVASAPAGTKDSPSAPAAPVALRRDSIRGIDHRAAGTAVIYRQPDGSLVVGLEDIDIQPGPDYDVYVVPGAERDDVKDAVRLDDLRGNKGTQYYNVPAGTDVSAGAWTVLIWCQTFDVPIAAATPT
jgi:hypothetical protein